VAWAAVLVLAVNLLVPGQEAAPPQPVMRSIVELPPGSYLTGPNIALSADGREIVVEASMDGRRVLAARALDELSFKAIPITGEAEIPSLSPDGTQVAFRQGSSLMRMPVGGGSAQTLSGGAGNFTVGQWSTDGFLYFTPSYKDGVFRVPVTGGAPESLTTPDYGRNELAHWWPQLLPDGDHVLYTAFRTPIDSAEIAVVSLATGETRTLLTGGITGRYTSTGHLLYARNDALFAVPFDVDALEVTGTAQVVVDDLAIDHVNGRGAYAISDAGTLIYVPASEYYAPNDLVWVDRNGREERIAVPAQTYSDPAISPDGRRIAMAITEPGEAPDVWVLDVARLTLARITSGGGSDFAPIWTPDGRDLVYESEQPVFDLFTRPADGSRPSRPLVQDEWDKYPMVVRGSTLTYTWESLPDNLVMNLDLGDPGTADTIFATDADLENPSVSPDGRWLSYTTDESGVHEIYVSSYPDVTRSRRQISSGGGREARWTKGGRELVYRAGPDLMSVSLDPETGEPGPPVRLFGRDYLWERRSLRSYDVTADGNRFVMMKLPPERAPRRIVVVSNFFEELKRITPADGR
jgi:serine/threonine-protein kinase